MIGFLFIVVIIAVIILGYRYQCKMERSVMEDGEVIEEGNLDTDIIIFKYFNEFIKMPRDEYNEFVKLPGTEKMRFISEAKKIYKIEEMTPAENEVARRMKKGSDYRDGKQVK